jgi:hypothetical protein
MEKRGHAQLRTKFFLTSSAKTTLSLSESPRLIKYKQVTIKTKSYSTSCSNVNRISQTKREVAATVERIKLVILFVDMI